MNIELAKLFRITSGDYHAVRELAPGTVPLVSCGDINHGFVGRFDIPPERRYSDVITVAYNGSPLTAKFRPYEFGAKDDIGILQPLQPISIQSLVYVAAVLNRMRWRYSYGRKCFKGKLEKLLVDVPVRVNGKSMEIDDGRIGKLVRISKLDKRPLQEVRMRNTEDRATWTRRRLDELFDLSRGDFHSLAPLAPGSWPTVSRTTNDNGVVGYYERPEGSIINDPGLITVSTVGGDAFVQASNFIVTDNVIVLRPRTPMLLPTSVLIAAMINRQKWRYSYGRQCYQRKLSSLTVEVPWRAGELDHHMARSIVEQLPYWGFVRETVGDMADNDSVEVPT